MHERCYGDGIHNVRLLTPRLCRSDQGPKNLTKLHRSLHDTGLVSSYMIRRTCNPGPRGMFLSSMIPVSLLTDRYGANVRPNASRYANPQSSENGPSKRQKVIAHGAARHAAGDREDTGTVPK